MLRQNQPLSDEQIRRTAPSVFAGQPWSGVSNKYAFIPTSEVLNGMRKEGFEPVAVAQSRTRIPGKADFTKHEIHFRDFRSSITPVNPELGMLIPEVVLTNGHDGTSAYVLEVGLWRLICLNGLKVAIFNLNPIRVRHTGNPGDVIDATYEVVEQFPQVLDSATDMNRLMLTAPEQRAFADAALTVRYGDDPEHPAPVQPEQVLRPRRIQDESPTLWNTYNVVQEHLTQGGDRGRTGGGRRHTTRRIQSITEDTRINKALWKLAEEMKKLKAA